MKIPNTFKNIQAKVKRKLATEANFPKIESTIFTGCQQWQESLLAGDLVVLVVCLHDSDPSGPFGVHVKLHGTAIGAFRLSVLLAKSSSGEAKVPRTA